MNWVDGVILGGILISALLAFARGFVREALGIAAWGGAAYLTYLAYPAAEPHVRGWIDDPNIAIPLTLGVIFIVVLIVLSLIAGWIARRVRRSAVGGLDRTLGLLFGLARGAALVIAAYMIAQWVVPQDRWPPAVREARALWPTCQGADWVDRQIPREHRPTLQPCPTGERIREADLLQAPPRGRAVRAAPTRAPREAPSRVEESN